MKTKKANVRKIILIFGSVILFFIFIISSIFFFRGGGSVSSEISGSIYVYTENSDVFIKKKESKVYEKITRSKTLIFEGYSIKTSDSYAHVELNDGSMISISPNSEILIEKNTDNQTKIEQILGNTWHRVQSLSGLSDATYEVENGSIQASVKGTEFAFMASTEGADLYVEEGLVNVKNKNSLKQLSQSQFVEANDENLNDVQDINDWKETNFYKRNIELSREYKEKKIPFDVQIYRDQMIEKGLYSFDPSWTKDEIKKKSSIFSQSISSISSSSIFTNSSSVQSRLNLPVTRFISSQSSSSSRENLQASSSSSSSSSQIQSISKESSSSSSKAQSSESQSEESSSSSFNIEDKYIEEISDILSI